ncbi:radical SAM protein [Lentibacillus salinarum]|uniref:Radical SAM protein n=1 Tax=Lentibacillus salinarum TaxID=446820 RepID=A0ABW3ZWZ6_9BACI
MRNYIDTFIIKTAAICNLNCTYCYYFNGADTSYLGRPKVMSKDLIKKTVDRIIEHTHDHNLKYIDVSLHGGEPLLMGKDLFCFMMEEINRIEESKVVVRRKIQTNAVLLDHEWLDLLAKYHVNVGISIDGPEAVNDKNRVDLGGRGTYKRAVKGLKAALNYKLRGLNIGVLSVINPNYSGRVMYNHLRDLGVEKIDFLLPEGNYVHLPFDYKPFSNQTPFADFIIEVFDAWLEEDNPDVFVRLPDRLIRSALNGDSQSDVFGNSPIRVAVVETDGSIEPTDNFKMCEDRMTNMGLSIFDNDFNDLCKHNFFESVLLKEDMVPSECAGCKYVDKCGGGRITTRYSKEHQFNKKTIYCHDLYKTMNHAESIVKQFTNA